MTWHRRKLGALAAAIAVVAIIGAVSPSEPPSTEVVVAAADLPGGHLLAAGDLQVVAYPNHLVPTDAVTDPGAVTGRALATAATEGQPLTTVSVVSPRRDPAPDGMVTAPLRLADTDVVALLAVGDVVDIIAADPQTGASAVIAEEIRITALPQPEASSGGLGGALDGGSTSGRLVLVEATPEVAEALAAAAVQARLSVVWR